MHIYWSITVWKTPSVKLTQCTLEGLIISQNFPVNRFIYRRVNCCKIKLNDLETYIAWFKTVSQTQSSDVRVSSDSLDSGDLPNFLHFCCCDSLRKFLFIVGKVMSCEEYGISFIFSKSSKSEASLIECVGCYGNRQDLWRLARKMDQPLLIFSNFVIFCVIFSFNWIFFIYSMYLFAIWG